MAEISPTEFDLIVLGTGLEESIIAAAAARGGKSVLQLDSAGSYGSHWSTLQLDQFLDWARSQQGAHDAAPMGNGIAGSEGPMRTSQHPSSSGQHVNSSADAASQWLEVPLEPGPALYTNVEVETAAGASLGPSREYNIDLAPKVVHCSGPLIDALLDAGAQHYLEFKLVQESYVWRGGRLARVPASRADVFRDRSLAPVDKRALMRFLAAAQAPADLLAGEQRTVPLVQLLREQGLSGPLREVIMYALACIGTDQERFCSRRLPAQGGAELGTGAGSSGDAGAPAQPSTSAAAGGITTSDDAPATAAAQQARPCQPGSADDGLAAAGSAPQESAARGGNWPDEAPVSAEEGLALLRQYLASVGRYGPGTAAFLAPLYGGGELPQAFARVAAVAGALCALRTPVQALLLGARGAACAGMRTASGQVLECKALAGNVDFLGSLLEHSACPEPSPGPLPRGPAVAQAVCIMDRPLQEGETQVLVVVPPGAAGNAHPVRALQVGAPTACAPADRYLLYLSTPSSGAGATHDLRAALRLLVDLSALDTLQQQRQQQQEWQQDPAQQSRSDSDSALPAAEAAQRGTAPETRPRALLAAFYDRAAGMSATQAQERLPANVALCAQPDAGLGYQGALTNAEAALARLLPGLGPGLFPGGQGDDGDESDEEAIEALSAALSTVAAA